MVYIVHPDLPGGAVVSDDPSVLAHYEQRGWEKADLPPELDPDLNYTPEPEPEPEPTKKPTRAKKVSE